MSHSIGDQGSYQPGSYNPKGAGGTFPAPTPAQAQFSAEDVQSQIAQMQADFDARMLAMEERHSAEMASVRKQATPVNHNVPEHAGGPGTSIRDTWSQWEQELSRAGSWTEPESD